MTNTKLTATISRVSRYIDSLTDEYAADRLDARDALIDILSNGSNPDDKFTLIGSGAYKECYDFGLSNYVIKFYSDDNPTTSEQYILEEARHYGFENLFLDSFYCELPTPIDAQILDPQEWVDESDYDNDTLKVVPTKLVGFIIQPLTKTDSSRDLLWWEPDDFDLVFGKLIPEEFDLLNAFSGSAGCWLQTVLDKYGDAYFKDFITFIDRFGLSDFHSGNIGWKGSQPIILDWLSEGPPENYNPR